MRHIVLCFSEFMLLAKDFDNDGYLSLSDLRSACEKFKIPNSSAMVLQSGRFLKICLGLGLGCFSKLTRVSGGHSFFLETILLLPACEVCFKKHRLLFGNQAGFKHPFDTPTSCLELPDAISSK